MKLRTALSNVPSALVALWLLALASLVHAGTPSDPLPSWNEGATKQAIIDFVGRVTKEGGADFVPDTRAHRHVR